MLRTREV